MTNQELHTIGSQSGIARIAAHAASTPPWSAPISRRAFLLAALTGSIGVAVGCSSGDSAWTPPIINAQAYPNPNLLVTPAWLSEHLQDADLRMVDCSSIRAYHAGHLPGAAHIWWQDTIEINNPVYGMLAGAPSRGTITRNAGLTKESDIVCYDNSGGVWAARIVWMLSMMGSSRVHLLDGGTQGWRSSGGTLTRNTPKITPGGIESPLNENLLAHGKDIVTVLGRPDVAIVDTRTAQERGETWYGRLRRGTIPGSIWVPRNAFLTETPTPSLAPPDDVRARLTAAGLPDSVGEVIVFGLHGTLACLPWIALRSLGFPSVRLYDGSWAEWGANSDWPIDNL